VTSTIPTPRTEEVFALDADVELPIEIDDERLDTPAVLVDLDVTERNIVSMAALAARRGVALRPHAKSHKSTYIADLQLAAGATGLCLATVGEVEVMWKHGISDLLLAYPVLGKRKLRRLAPMVDAEALTMVADSLQAAAGYSELARSVGRTLPLLIEVDSGMHRVGVLPQDAGALAARIHALPGLHVRGILTHAGHSHQAPDQQGIERVARDEVRAMQKARESLESHGIDVEVVSAGSTITTPYLSAEDGITEVRPGTYVYNDLRTLSRYACTADQLAVSMLATVVSRAPGRATLNTGSKSITASNTEQHGYGHLLNRPRSGFSLLSEEHGVLDLAPEDEDLQVGDRVRVHPIHICVWMDLHAEVYGVRGNRVEKRIRVDAMRRSL
jgi:D-serine deaminase-like pyridoxal phosphate-dependent protein